MNSKRKLDDPDWSEAEDDTRDTSKKGGARLPEDYDCAPPLSKVILCFN
jgi:hypothetical protein